jgi:glycosyltransferase involved in cell wall biosynthesis
MAIRETELAGRRVLITGINYWPEKTGIAPYTTGMAEYLVQRGWDVSVICGMPHYPDWKIEEGYEGKLRHEEEVNGVRLIRRRGYIPNRPSAVRRGLYEVTFLGNGAVTAAFKKADAVIGVSPSVSGGVMAAFAARRHRVPYGLIFQDLAGQAAAQSGTSGGAKVAGATAAFEGWAARGASAIGVIAEGFKPHLKAMGVQEDRIHRIRNWTHIGQPTRSPQEVRRAFGLPEDAYICLHAGNMGLKQGLENVVDAARLSLSLPNPPVFVLMGGGNQRDHLEAYSAGLPNVIFLPAQPEETFPDVLAAADVLLVNQRPSVVDFCLPGKLTSYLAVGRPVIAAVANESETGRELRNADAGVVVDAGDPAQLLDAICDLRVDANRAQELSANGQTFAFGHLSADAALQNIEELVVRVARESQQPH